MKDFKSKWEMRFDATFLEMSESEFAILRDLIHNQLGLFYSDNKRDLLGEKLSPLVIERGFNSFLDYYYLLKYDSFEADKEWKLVADALRVPETFFWREYEQIKALVEVLVPKHFATSTSNPLRIWSAACSSGEEPLTIVLALKEAGWFERAPIEIFASDISNTAITKAKEGVYRNYSMRNVPTGIKSKYFQEQNKTWTIAPEIINKVKWITANLTMKSKFAHLALSSVIFCRNVFIYFSDKQIAETVQTFFDFMPTPGYLFVGSSESLLRITTDFDLQEINGTYVYVKQ